MSTNSCHFLVTLFWNLIIEYAGTPIVLLILPPPLRLAGKTVKEIMEEARAMEKMAERVSRIMAMEEFPLPTLPHLLFQIQVAQFHLFTFDYNWSPHRRAKRTICSGKINN